MKPKFERIFPVVLAITPMTLLAQSAPREADRPFREDSISEVVVTALGISRQEKSLGYSVRRLSGDDVNAAVGGNWLDNLNGKVSGMSMINAGMGPLGTVRVTLRGDRSLNYNNNEALIVVDGVPINSGGDVTGSGSNYANGDAPVDFGSGVGDLNPEDIESVTVLKGPAATALYGSLAGNGAIVITTKAGKQSKGIGISINSSLVLDKAGFFPDFQSTYGSGADMGLSPFSFWALEASEAPDGIAVSRNISRYAFGEKFDSSKLRYQYASKNWADNTYEKRPWVYADDWYTGFFQTGVTWKNSVTVSGGNGKGTMIRASFTDTRNSWITPNTGYRGDDFSLAVDAPLHKAIRLSARANYSGKQSDNLPVSGYSAQSPMYALVWGYNNNSVRLWEEEYRQGRYNAENYNNTDGTHGRSLVFPSSDSYNPYRTAYEELNKLSRNRVFGNVQLKFNILPQLSLTLRTALDMSDDWRTQQKPFLTPNFLRGFYREQSTRKYRYNHDFLLRYVNDFFDNRLSFSASFGGNAMTYKYYSNSVTLNQLQIDGAYNISNLPQGYTQDVSNYRSVKKINSLYGFASVGWNDTYYLDLTARNDWSSTLSRSNRSYFYPSVSASILLNKALMLDRARWIDLLKLRLSWANVGNDTSPYALDRYYSESSTYLGSYTVSGTIPRRDLKPENVESWEAGFDGKLFRGRLGFDVTAYISDATNQIITVSADQITGATGYRINAGKIRNKGIEISLSGEPVRTRDFSWTIDVNWSKNWNKLVSLQDDWDPAQPLQTPMGTTIGNRVYVYSYVGHQMNYIYGRGYQRAPEGAYYLDEQGNKVDCSGMKLVDANGYPILDTKTDRNLGKVDPDWRGGLTTRLRYRNLTLSMVFTAAYGGHCFSVTNFSLSYQGKLKNSLEGRHDGLVVEGVRMGADGSYSKNTTIVPNIETYYNAYVWNRNNTEENTFSTSFLKFKELRLDYRLSPRLLRALPAVRELSLGVYATNLFCLTDFPQYDPEAGMVNDGSIHAGIEAMTYPMTRSYGFNVKLSF